MDVRSHLTLIGPIRTVVIGHYGECSPDVHHLVRAAAEVLAAKRWRTMGARSEMEARGFFMDTLRKQLSINQNLDSHRTAPPQSPGLRRHSAGGSAAHEGPEPARLWHGGPSPRPARTRGAVWSARGAAWVGSAERPSGLCSLSGAAICCGGLNPKCRRISPR